MTHWITINSSRSTSTTTTRVWSSWRSRSKCFKGQKTSTMVNNQTWGRKLLWIRKWPGTKTDVSNSSSRRIKTLPSSSRRKTSRINKRSGNARNGRSASTTTRKKSWKILEIDKITTRGLEWRLIKRLRISGRVLWLRKSNWTARRKTSFSTTMELTGTKSFSPLRIISKGSVVISKMKETCKIAKI